MAKQGSYVVDREAVRRRTSPIRLSLVSSSPQLSDEFNFSPKSLISVRPDILTVVSPDLHSARKPLSGYKSIRSVRSFHSKSFKKKHKLALGKLLDECAELQKDLEGEWEKAATDIATKREEYEQVLSQYEEKQNLGPWKTNTKYRLLKQEIKHKLKMKPDPVADRDKEVVLRVACAAPKASVHQNYVSLADMTTSRLQFLSKAAKRGFGQSRVSLETLMSNIDTLRTPKPFYTTTEPHETTDIRLQTEPSTIHKRSDTQASQLTRSSTSPINEFIMKQRRRYLHTSVSRTLIERKKLVEVAMEKIQSSPDIARKVEKIEQANKARLQKYKKSQTVRMKEEMQEDEIKQEIEEYRLDPKQEMAMDRRVRKSVLMGKGDKRKMGWELLLGHV